MNISTPDQRRVVSDSGTDGSALILDLARTGRLIDVRTPVEFAAERIPGAVNIPLDQFEQHLSRLVPLHGSIAIVCHSGRRAQQAVDLLRGGGRICDTILVEGGTVGWRESGGLTERGRRAISLERQVRIVAGAIVATGAALTLAVSPTFAVVPFAIGSGLVFAGVTDTCAMGMLLARMPWNRGGMKSTCEV